MQPYYHYFNPAVLGGSVIDALWALGWFRMQQSIFTTSHIGHSQMHRVHWLRFNTTEICEHNSHCKIRARSKHFHHTIEDFKLVRFDHAALHNKYRASIDFDGANSIEECMFGEGHSTHTIFNTKCISLYDGTKLIAGGYFDIGVHAAASILHFFDPDYSRYSLGKYLILLTIDYMKHSGGELYYPGYVVEGVSKMNYKLFLGKQQAQYFEPETAKWKYFQDSILMKQTTAS